VTGSQGSGRSPSAHKNTAPIDILTTPPGSDIPSPGSQVPDSWLLRHLPAAVVAVDEQGAVLYWNDEASIVFGRALNDVMGRTVAALGVWPQALSRRSTDPGTLDEARWEEEHTAKRPDGTSVRVRTRLVRVNDAETGFRGLVGTSVTTSDRRREQLTPARLPLTAGDPATGLANSQVFMEHLERSMRRNASSGLRSAVFSVGLVNVPGAATGSDLPRSAIRALAKRITSVVRERDLVAYLGAVEFAVCCDVWDKEDAIVVAQRILRSAATVATNNPPLRGASARIGVAVANEGSRADALLLEAKAAMSETTKIGVPPIASPGDRSP
jgi:diguanylate cyclase (GGDEF)-like protein/PAS domain S-box-containing protein